MTIINPNSISGISSITALNSTAAINLFKADGTSANIIAGVVTATSLDISGDIDVDGHTELDNVRISGIASVHNTLQFTNTGGGHIDHGAVNHNLNFRVSKSSTADTTMMQINAAAEQTKFRKIITVGLQGGGDTTQIGGGSGIGAYLQLNYANNNIVNTKLLGNGNSWLNSNYGNLGIGTQSPQRKLHVIGTTRPAEFGSYNAVSIVKLYNSATGRGAYNGFDFTANSTSGGIINFYGGSIDLRTSTSNGSDATSRLLITSTGAIQFSGTNNADNTNKLVYLTTPSYDTDEEPFGFIHTGTYNNQNLMYLGGGMPGVSYNACTLMKFYTTPSVNTLTGTERLCIESWGGIQNNQGAIYGGGEANEPKVHFNGAAPSNDPARGQLAVSDSAAYNASPIARISLVTRYNSSGGYTFMGGIEGGKENSTDGQYGGFVRIMTRPHGNTIQERLRISSTGHVTKPASCAFNVTHNGNQNYSSAGTHTITSWKTTQANKGFENTTTGGYFSGGIFTAPVTGAYFFTSTILLKDMNGTNDVHLIWSKNNTYYSYWETRFHGTPTGYQNYEAVSGQCTMYMTAGDTCRIKITFTGSGCGIYGADSNWGNWGGFLIG